MEEKAWSIIVHGGAKTISPEHVDANRAGCLAAAELGANILRAGGSALDAAQAAVTYLEDDPTFNAGRGSVRNNRGEIEMDAAIMDGTTLNIGAIAAVKGITNPIKVARALLKEPEILLIAEGACDFAREKGFVWDQVEALPSVDAQHDTVGCVAMDDRGGFAAATSTGGLSKTRAGRVGDSPLPGCGLYAQDLVGAVSMSGDGESIIQTMLAGRIMHALEALPEAQHAAKKVHSVLQFRNGEAGAIVLDRSGGVGIAHNSRHFATAIARHDLEARSAIHMSELADVIPC